MDKRRNFKKVAVISVVCAALLGVGGGLLVRESKLNALQREAMEALAQLEGKYDEKSIVLASTTAQEAKAIATKLNAKLRLTADGSFATLTLTDGRTIEDVYETRAYRELLADFSPDYKTSVAELQDGKPSWQPSAPNYTVTDTAFVSQEYLNYVHIGDAWSTNKGSYATVAVIDTGIDTDHSEFASRISSYSYNATEDKIVRDYKVDGGYDWSLIEDEHGHGTAVAGVISAAMNGEGTVGIAPNAQLLVIKAECDEDGTFARTSDLVFGLYYAVERGVSVVNMSFGGYGDNLYADAALLAKNSGVVCVASAGNAPTANHSYPAADENVLGVGALKENSFELAEYSAYGENTDLVAPGTVYTTKMGGGYASQTGTSFAAPIVAGAAALRFVNRFVNGDFVQEELLISAYDLGETGKDLYYGYGVVDIHTLICEPRYTVTFDMMTAELENETRKVAANRSLQEYPEPTKLYSVFTGWYYDAYCTQRVNASEIFTGDATLYAGWENESVVDGEYLFSYRVLADATVEITGYNGKRTAIVIPELIDGKKVTSIADGAFKKSKYRRVTLPDTLTRIGKEAFAQCWYLYSIRIPNNVTELGVGAFADTPSLRELTFGEASKLTEIPSEVFKGSGVRSLTLPASVRTVGGNAFLNAARLSKLEIPQTGELERIGSSAFFGTSLQEVSLPQSLRVIEQNAFQNTSLSAVRFAENGLLAEIGGGVFQNTKLVSVTLPASLKALGADAFYKVRSLREIRVAEGNTVFRAKDGILYDYTGRTLLLYPAGKTADTYTVSAEVTQISAYAFAFADVKNVVLSGVERIGAYAFAYAKLEKADVPDTVTALGEGAFGYSAIQSVELGTGVTALTSLEFFGCEDLKTLEIPAHVVLIGGAAFANTGLTEVTFATDSELVSITGGAFAGNTALQSIEIPASVVTIGGKAFSEIEVLFNGEKIFTENTDLYWVQFAENAHLQEIGANAFLGNKNLQTLYLPHSVKKIGAKAFLGSGLIYVELSNDLQEIGAEAFKGSALNYVQFPNLLQIIGENAFSRTALSSVTLPASLTSLGNGAFGHIETLSAIDVEYGNTVYASEEGVLFNADKTLLVQYPMGREATEYYIIDSVTDIQKGAFDGVALQILGLPASMTVIPDGYFQEYAVREFVLAEGTKTIGDYAFASNWAMEKITIPDSVTEIGTGAFYDCRNMETVAFGDNSQLKRFSSYVFEGTGLLSIRVPKNISSIATYAFYNCTKLTEITFAAGSRLESVTAGNFAGCNQLTSVVFESDSALKTVGAQAFTGMAKLTTVDFGGATVEEVGAFAFRGCDSLTNLTLSDELRSIGRFAFAFARSLTRLDIPAGIENVGEFAFYGCGNLTVYFKGDTLPDSLGAYWDEGFKGYYVGVEEVLTAGDYEYAKLKGGGIAIVRYNGAETALDLTALPLEGTVTSIGAYAFYGSAVERIILPQTLTSIQAYAFAYSALQSVEIPASVRFIGNAAFSGSALKELVFAADSELTRIERYAFANCTDLQDAALPQTLAELGAFAFWKSGLQTVTFAENGALTHIAESAFAATKLHSVTLPKEIVEVGYNAFRDNLALQSITLDCTSLQLRENAFYNSGLTALRISSGVELIGEYVFTGITSLTAIEVDDDNAYYASKDGILYDKSKKKLLFAPAGRTAPIVIARTVESLGNGAFENSMASDISFESGSRVYSIGARTFYGVKNIKEITLPKSVVAIEYYAFAMNESLERVYFEAGSRLDAIYEGVFYGCEKLREIRLPNAVAEISPYAFYGCSSLETLPLESTESVYAIGDYAFAHTGLTEFTITDEVREIGEYAFEGTGLKEFVVPSARAADITIGFGALAGCNEIERLSVPFLGKSLYRGEGDWLGYIFGAAGYATQEYYIPASLTSVTIGEGLEFLSEYAFNGVTSLQEVYLPQSLRSIGGFYKLFDGCDNLEKIVVAEGNGFYASMDGVLYELSTPRILAVPKKVTSVRILDGVQEIENSAFQDCTLLTMVNMPDSVTTIREEAFYGCTALTQVTFSQGLTIIGNYAFYGCAALTQVAFPQGLTGIGDHAFSRSAIEEICLPESATSVSEYAFTQCGNVTRIEVGSGVESIVSWCTDKVKTIVVAEENPYILARDHILYSKTQKRMLRTFGELVGKVVLWEGLETLSDTMLRDETGITEIVINEGIASIPYRTFGGCTSLQAVTLPSTLKAIDVYAFYECASLTKIVIPEGVTSIGNEAFYGCTSLQEVTLPKSLESIGEYAFAYCAKLTKITLHEGLQSVAMGAFADTGLTELVLPDSVTYFNGYHYTTLQSLKIGKGITALPYDAISYMSELTSLEIYNPTALIGVDTSWLRNATVYSQGAPLSIIEVPKEMTEVELGQMFYDISSLKGLKLHSGVTKITQRNSTIQDVYITDVDAYCEIEFSSWDFQNLYVNDELLTELTVTKATSIKAYAFKGCTTLQTVTLTNGVQSVGEYAFLGCSSLQTVTLANSVQSVGEYAFEGCSSLQTLTLPDNLQTIGYRAFSGCSSLQTLALPDSVQTIGSYAFYACTALQTLTLSSGLTEIEASVFSQCRSLAEVVIPEGVTKIGNGAFGLCAALQTVTLPTTLEEINSSAFSSNMEGVVYNYSDLPLRVCNGDAGTYLAVPEIIDKDGNRFYCGDRYEYYIRTSDGFVFYRRYAGYWGGADDPYRYSSYMGEAYRVTLPTTLLGEAISYEYSLSGIRELFIPKDFTSFTFYQFDNNLENVVVEEGHSDYFVYDGVLYSKTTNTVVLVPQMLSGVVRIPEGVETLGAENTNACFYNRKYIQEIVLSDSVKEIVGNTAGKMLYAFEGCTALQKITLGENLAFIADNTFANCKQLEHIFNRSSLVLTIGGMDNGGVAQYAKLVLDKDGNTVYVAEDGYQTIDTADGFRFVKENGEYRLIAYLGTSDTVNLPATIEGSTYSLYRVRGGKHYVFPDSFTEVSYEAFYENSVLQTVTLGAGIKIIDAAAFQYCRSLTKVVLPEGLTDIYEAAFFDCTALTEIELPESLTCLNLAAFSGCTGLKKIVLPSGLTDIGNEAFRHCTGLTEIILPSGVTSIGSEAFRDCTGLTEIILPSGLTSIGSGAFNSCAGLTEIVLPDSVTRVGNNAFSGCSLLTKIHIGKGLTDASALIVSTLRELTVSPENEAFFALDNVLYTRESKEILFVPKGIAGTLTIWAEAVAIGQRAFYECTAIEKVLFPQGLKTIGAQAFYGCSALTGVVFPEGLESIGEGAFYGCSTLTGVVFPEGLESIGEEAFSGCLSLTELALPKAHTLVAQGAFRECSALTKITLPDALTEIQAYAFFGCSALTELVLPESVTKIGVYAFGGCGALTEIALPNNLTELSVGVFKDCTALQKIELPSGMTSIGNYTFTNCSSLAEIALPENLTSLGSDVFKDCAALTELTIPDGVPTIGSYLFNGCLSLKTLTLGASVGGEIGWGAFWSTPVLERVEVSSENASLVGVDGIVYDKTTKMVWLVPSLMQGTVTLWSEMQGFASGNASFDTSKIEKFEIAESNEAYYTYSGVLYNKADMTVCAVPGLLSGTVHIPVGVTNVTGFGSRKLITEIIFPEGVQTVGSLSGCTSLKGLTIPEGVTSIGALNDCTSLESITIPKSVTSIGSLYGLSNLRSVYNYSDISISIDLCGDTNKPMYLSDKVGEVWRYENGLTFERTADGFLFEKRSGYNYARNLIGYEGDLKELVLPENHRGATYSVWLKEGKIGDVQKLTVLSGISVEDLRACTALQEIVLLEGLTEIRPYLFDGLTALKKVTLPEGITAIGSCAFRNCTSLTEISLPTSLISIDQWAFYGCTGLTELALPANITAIPYGVFSDCTGLTGITLPANLISIGQSAFYGCSDLQEVTFPESLATIDYEAFYGCSGLTEVVLPDSLTSLGGRTFLECTGLTKVYVGKSLSSFDIWSFGGYLKLQTIEVSAENEYFISYENVVYKKEDMSVYFVPAGIRGTVRIADGVKTVNCMWERGFQDAIFMTELILPDSVETIETHTFSGCTNLRTVTLGENVSSIGSYAFPNATSIIYNNSGLTLEEVKAAFYGYRKIIMPDGSVCYVNGITEYEYVETADGFFFLNSNGAYTLVDYVGTETELTLPKDIFGEAYVVGNSAFRGKPLVSLTVPSTVKSIGSSAFADCDLLTSLTIENGVETLGSGAFWKCTALTEVYLPESVVSLSSAFKDCSSLLSVTVKGKLTTVDYNPFEGTPYFEDKANWTKNGCFIVGGALFEADENVTYIDETIYSIAYGVALPMLKYIVVGNPALRLYDYKNLETVVYDGCSIQNANMSYNSAALKNIVLLDGCDVRSNWLFRYFDVTIYAEEEFEKAWAYYEGWNGENPVYYGENWITAKFYDENSELIDVGFYLNSQVVRQPYYYKEGNEQYSYRLVGWDLNGDGVADTISATAAYDFSAYALIERVVNKYPVNFFDGFGGVYATFALPYGEVLTLPKNPTRKGYTFLGWDGYEEGVTTTQALTFTALWVHDGDGHEYADPILVQSTCEAQGYQKHVCTVCGEWYATDFTAVKGHSYSVITVAPTCEAEGYDLHTCSTCGGTYADNYTACAGHSYGEWQEVLAATCVKAGMDERQCSVCFAWENRVTGAKGHAFTIDSLQKATCQKNGVAHYVCKECGEVFDSVTQKTEHAYVRVTEARSLIERLLALIVDLVFGGSEQLHLYQCKGCGVYMTHSAVSSLGYGSSVQGTSCEHSLGEPLVIEEGNCLVGAVVAYPCETCGEYVSAQRVAAIGHDIRTHEGLAATCFEDGYEPYETCTRCAYTTYQAIKATGHSYSDWTGTPSCTTGTVATKTCTVCGDTVTETLAPTGHSYSDWTETTKPKCETAGEESRKCSSCGDTQTREVEATGHTFSEWETGSKATCETTGEEFRKCDICSALETKEIAAIGHSFTDWMVVLPATCTRGGEEARHCEHCDTRQTRSVAMTPHSLVHVDEKPATCTEKGHKAYVYCTECSYDTYEDFPIVPHTAGDWVVVQEPQEFIQGYRQKYCEVCGEAVEGEIIPALPGKGNNVATTVVVAVGGVSGVGTVLFFILRKRRFK
ncbi:MAG: leucine-rich repeat protein [Clostridia bacterium]|nr:leucine-rich repeat protein [Clostridia bacterium]